jgi:hypothetical protein
MQARQQALITERKLLAISSPCGMAPPLKPKRCQHGTRLDLQDCMQCADAAEVDEGFPVGTLRDGMRGFRGGTP